MVRRVIDLFKGLSRYINSMKIRHQLLVTYLIAGIIPIAIIGVYLAGSMHNLVLQQQISETKDENVKVENSLKHLTDLIADVSDSIYYDSDLRALMSKHYPDIFDFETAAGKYMKITTIEQEYSEIGNIRIYDNNPTIFDSSYIRSVSADVLRESWYKRALQSWETTWSTTTGIDGEQYLSLARQLPTDKPGIKAVLVIDINKDYLCSLARGDLLKTVAAVENGRIVLSDDYNDLGEKIFYNVPDGANQKVRIIRFGGRDTLAVMNDYELSTSNDAFSILTLNPSAIKRVNDVTMGCVYILLLSIIVPFLLIVYFTGVFSRRVNTLRQDMNCAAAGNLGILENPGGNDEISDLYAGLNVMIDGIKKLVNEIYLEKLMKERMINSQQKIEFKMLASQINPHFLYNTLETIRMKLICNGDRETANVIKLVGKTMRRMLEVRNETVTLDSELEYIKYYLEIQRFRFGSRISYEIGIDDKIDPKKIYLLPLLLQPIVENAFVHGLEDKTGGGKITLDIRSTGNMLQVVVEDDGIGMPPEKCDSLNSSLSEIKEDSASAKSSIGLCNVHQRIMLYYGKSYGVKISSRMNWGTKVMINLPLDGGIG